MQFQKEKKKKKKPTANTTREMQAWRNRFTHKSRQMNNRHGGREKRRGHESTLIRGNIEIDDESKCARDILRT